MQDYGVIVGILAIVAFIGFIQYRSMKAKKRSGSGSGAGGKSPSSRPGFKDDSDN